MTNEDLLQNLKQFITVTVSQQIKHHLDTILDSIETQLAAMATKDDLKQLQDDMEQFDEKLDAIQDSIAETFASTAEFTNVKLQNHEQRLTKLERRTT